MLPAPQLHVLVQLGYFHPSQELPSPGAPSVRLKDPGDPLPADQPHPGKQPFWFVVVFLVGLVFRQQLHFPLLMLGGVLGQLLVLSLVGRLSMGPHVLVHAEVGVAWGVVLVDEEVLDLVHLVLRVP
ncbi:hypothetical protein LSTR_LSTR015419 [Laodelphax striatellus]|uniref:Uncharacterized protein n=1 Tax=Laodelphax striatellus TaxID=195883 RepID=A0A482X7T0_LAOST|nr:hypothetical protein LSTR_LSTR015419 [Laodelphax striatellus]